MKIKTNTLTRDALDWAVTKADYEINLDEVWRNFRCDCLYSEDWLAAGPIIEREKISIEFLYGAGDAGDDIWIATRHERPGISEETGPTPLIAAMRCYVASKLGDEIEVPDELVATEKERNDV